MEPDAELCAALRNVTVKNGFHPDISTRPSGASFQLGFFYFQNCALALFLLTFVIFKYVHPSRAKFSRIQKRSVPYIFITHLGASFTSVICSWYQSHNLENGLPCWTYLVIYFSQVPCLVFPLVARLLDFYRDAQWTTAIMMTVEQEHEQQQQQDVNSKQGQMVSNASEAKLVGKGGHHHHSNNPLSSLFCYCCCFFFSGSERNKAEVGTAPASSGVDTEADLLGNNTTTSAMSSSLPSSSLPRKSLRKPNTPTTSSNEVGCLKSRLGARLVLLLFFLPFSLMIPISLGMSPMVQGQCWGCAANTAEEVVLLIESLLALLLLVICYRLNRKRTDPFGFVHEVRLAVWLGGVPALLFFLVNAITRVHFQGDFQVSVLIELSLLTYCFIQSGLQCILAIVDSRNESSAMAKTAFSIKEFEHEFLRKDAPFHEAFGKHLASEHGYESLAFLLGVFQWEKEFFDVNPKTCRGRAKKIVNMYVGDQAECPCNLSENCVKSTLATLQKTDEELKYDFFSFAKTEIIKMLYRDSFRRFVRTKEYRSIATATFPDHNNNSNNANTGTRELSVDVRA